MAHRAERELKAKVRPARPDEADALLDILKTASLANPGDRDWLLAHPEVMVVDAALLAQGRCCVAEGDEGQALGFAVLLPPQGGEAEIDGVFVRPEHWRQGVGRALLQACAERARAEGATALRVVVNPHALRFYAALGFELDPGEHAAVSAGVAWVMRRQLLRSAPH